MDTVMLRTAGITTVCVFDTSVDNPLNGYLDIYNPILNKQPQNIEDYGKLFDMVKSCIQCEKLMFTAICADRDTSKWVMNFAKHDYIFGNSFSEINNRIMNWNYYAFIYENNTFHVFKQMFLSQHSHTKIRTIYEKDIAIRYINHYWKLFEKQYKDGGIVSHNTLYVVYPVVDSTSDNFTEVVEFKNA